MDNKNILRLNLGCGTKKRDGFINIDNRKKVQPDVCCDIIKGLPYDDNSVSHIRAFDFLEHIPIGKTILVIEEIYRVLKPGGIFEHFTPSTDGRGAFQDPTHVSYWNLNSWIYYFDDKYRNLYGIKAKFYGINKNVDTDKGINLIHVYGIMFAIK